MHWIFLSPHLDDVALSCGGLVWEQAQAGDEIHIWTICAGDPPAGPLSPFAQSLHRRWQTGLDAMAIRREEDLLSCKRLFASPRHFPIADCIYRQGMRDGQRLFLYASEESLFGPLHAYEEDLIKSLAVELRRSLPGEARLVCPLTLGGHVDHRLVRAAAERLGRDLLYYADYPYLLEASEQIAGLAAKNWQQAPYSISAAGLAAWQEAVAAHKSQISTFWEDEQTMKLALKTSLEHFGGLILWQKPPFKSYTKLANPVNLC